jgi:hypothetical protein
MYQAGKGASAQQLRSLQAVGTRLVHVVEGVPRSRSPGLQSWAPGRVLGSGVLDFATAFVGPLGRSVR